MTKSQYPYPPDEFDVRGPEGAPVGVHREPRSGWSSIWPYLLVAVVFAGLAVGIVSFLSDDGGTEVPPTASEQSAGADGTATEAPAEGETPADGEGDPASEAPADETSEEPVEEEPAAMPGDASAANLAASVIVWNDGAGSGQAGAGVDVLKGADFTEVGPDDAVNAPVKLDGVYDATTVLYGADRADTATAVAEALGVDAANVQESDDVTASSEAVWVILTEPVG